MKVFILIAPFAILSLCNSRTSWFFKAWIKSFIAMLLLQTFIALILLICFIVQEKDSIRSAFTDFASRNDLYIIESQFLYERIYRWFFNRY